MLNENQLKFMCYCQFSMILGVGKFVLIRQKYLNAETCKLYTFSVHSFETLAYHTFFINKHR